MICVSLALFGCNAPADESEQGLPVLDAGVDGATLCNAQSLASCEYRPAIVATPGGHQTTTLSYQDVIGETRSFEIDVRLPGNVDGAVPVVVWSHGGPNGLANAGKVGAEWGEVFNSAGYAFVAIAHATRERPSFDTLCAAIGVPATDCEGAVCTKDDQCDRPGPAGIEKGACLQASATSGFCAYFKHLSYDRPHDAEAVFDWLEASTASGGMLAGKLDLTRLVYAGHSSGAGSAFMIAGATRQYGGVDALYLDPRPRAFITASPQGPGEEQFTVESFTGAGCLALASDPSVCLTRPVLALTGVGDQTDGIDPVVRKQCIELAPPGDKHLGWLTTLDAKHEYFDLNPNACGSPDPARCQAIKTWLSSAAVAFLDAYAKDSDAAHAYLASDALTVLSGGELEHTSR